MRRLALAALLVVTACGQAADPTSTTSSVAPTSTVSPVTTAPLYEQTSCPNAPPRPWSTLCRAHELILAHHVDAPESSALAAAAVAGVRRTSASAADSAVPAPSTVRCVVPDATFQPVCEAIAERHHSDGLPVDALVEGAVQGMFRLGLDPFSAYLAPDFADRLDELGSGFVYSLGLVVGARDSTGAACGPVSETCRLTVLAVFDFGPAERAGVVTGDVIAAVDEIPTLGLAEAEVVAALHGDAGESTSITLTRTTGPTLKVLTHEDIRFEPAEFMMVTSTIAYLRLNDFSQAAAQAVGQVLGLAEVEAASGLVLDLRDNPGGLVLSAQAVASQFLESGIVLTEQTRTGAFDLPVIEGGLAPPGLDVIVLTNSGTASAAEVVAAALQAAGRAIVVGEPTFGKNLVQQVFSAPRGGEFRISVARWTGPTGIDVGVTGLQPDLVVDDVRTEEADPVLAAALELLGF